MIAFAELTLNPGGLIAWLAVGLVAGFLAGRVMEGGAYGLVGDLVVGLIGSIVGGVLFGSLAAGEPHFIGSILVAFVGACLLIAAFRLFGPRRSRL